MKNFRLYIREKIGWLAVILLTVLLMTAILLLNRIPVQEIVYGILLCLFVTAIIVATGYGRHCESFRQLEELRKNIAIVSSDMKESEYMYEEYYQDCIRVLGQEKDKIQKELLNRQQDITAYYSMWVHQMKTPIVAMKLLLDEEMNIYLDIDEIEENDTRVINIRQKQNELFRIEQYVDMALQYTRLGAETNDFVLQNILLDEVIRPSIHKYAKQFVYKQLRLNYNPQSITASTDKKWLGFVMDQLLSNAVKYTKKGGVTIQVCCIEQGQMSNLEDVSDNKEEIKYWYEKNTVLQKGVRIVVEDTGIGISAEDLPRVCEKGYTGYNGHADKYSTGIGLYLCQAILKKLGHQFQITSEQGKGTKAEIVLFYE